MKYKLRFIIRYIQINFIRLSINSNSTKETSESTKRLCICTCAEKQKHKYNKTKQLCFAIVTHTRKRHNLIKINKVNGNKKEENLALVQQVVKQVQDREGQKMTYQVHKFMQY